MNHPLRRSLILVVSCQMQKALLILVLLISASGATADIFPESVDPTLTIVSTQIDTRILVYSVCSPEHCWSDTYLQLLSPEPDQTSVLCTTQIKEISVGYTVNDVKWTVINGGPRIELSVSASHGGFEPSLITLTPLDGCNYSFSDSRVGN